MIQDMTTMLKRMYSPLLRQAHRMSTKLADMELEMKLNDDVYTKIENEEMKARKHPGRLSTRIAVLPEWLNEALPLVLEDKPLKTLMEDGKRLSNHLHERQIPTEENACQVKLTEIKQVISSQRNMEKLAHLSMDSIEKIENAKSLRLLKRAFYVWSPVAYNKYLGLVYLVARSAQEYAVLHKILGEIAGRDEEFKPKTMFDFGSGVGTAVWAANQLWPQKIQEHMCVDVSADMNDISEAILAHSNPKIKGVFHRQYLPISQRTYDIVVSAYSLLELPTMQTRLESIAKLWAKTEQYLIIVEQGTTAGFRLVNEARDFIIYMQRSRKDAETQSFHIFSPCPHHSPCPRYHIKPLTPCNFQTSYQPLPLRNKERNGTDRYSYIVIKKGECTDETKNWPRLVRETLVRSKHSICRMCTAQGNLEEKAIRASIHGKWLYWCARSSRWGDRLPVETRLSPILKEEEEVVDDEEVDDDEEVNGDEETAVVDETEK